MALSRLVMAPLVALAVLGSMAPATAVPVVTDTIPVGTNPFGVAVSPDGTRAYVTNYGSASVSVINTTTKAVTATIPVNGSPRGVAVSPNGTRAYSANRFTASVSVINTASDVVSASIGTGDSPLAIAITPNGDRAYVTLPTSSGMSVLDLSNNTVSGLFGVGDARAVAISPVHARAYTTISDMNVVSVINTSNDTVTTNIPVGSAPDGVAVSPDGTRVYVANSLDDTVSVIDTSNDSVISTIAVGAGPLGVAVSPDSAHVYITNSAADTVSVIDTSNNTVTDTIAVGDAPRGVAVSPDGARAYVTNFNDNTVSVLELQPAGFSVSPSTVPFGNQLVGAASSAQTLTVTNTGTSNLTISAKGLAGADPGQFALGADTCNTPVAPGNTCTIAVSFSPTSPGDKSATLEFTSNALTSPDTVTLSGTGVQPVLNASPDSLDFATVNVGQAAGPQTVTVTNTGTGKLTVSASTVTGAGFSLAGDTCTNTEVPVGGTCAVQVSFAPAAEGATSGQLSFTSNAPGSPHTVALTGTGTKAAKKKQTLKTKLPKRIKISGLTVITPANARTNAGQLVRTIVRGGPAKPTAAGEVRYYTVVRGPNGKTSVRTYGYPNLRIKVTQKAPATDGYTAFTRTATYTRGTRN